MINKELCRIIFVSLNTDDVGVWSYWNGNNDEIFEEKKTYSEIVYLV